MSVKEKRTVVCKFGDALGGWQFDGVDVTVVCKPEDIRRMQGEWVRSNLLCRFSWPKAARVTFVFADGIAT